ncbi:class I SAM-dependent methyltransferase [Citrobacter sp. wls706]|nr:class I SAM-dependent methyltransferase [Citrobacter sp. wls706]
MTMDIKKVEKISLCKICNSEASLYGVIDFNELHGRHGLKSKLSGQPIYYHRCEHCGLIYTNAFDHWNEDDFSTYIYNDEYIHIDPDFPELRPQQNARFLIENFSDIKSYHMLDFGCGNNKLVDLLKEKGVDATGWDPFYQNDSMPQEKFEFIVSFEVMEHTPDPIKTVSLIDNLLNSNNGKFFFSTLNNDSRLHLKMDDWYILPRGGHVSYYSTKSLNILFHKFNMEVHHICDGLHLAFK